MIKNIFCTGVLLLCSQLQQAHAYDFNKVAEKHILPAYQKLSEKTSELDKAAQQGCNKEILQQKSKSAFLAWQGAQHIRFGPVQFFSREHRFAFWPDKRGVVGKQLNKLMLNDALLEDDFDLTQKSVAMQGFSVLERLLFTDSKIDEKKCILIKAIANNLNAMSEGIIEDWVAGNDSYLKYFSNPSSKNLIYKNETELASQLVNSLYTQLELIIKQKIKLSMGESIEKANSMFTEAWRSESGLPALNANLHASYELFLCTFYAELMGEELQQEIVSAYESVFVALENITMPLAGAIQDKEQREAVKQLQAQVSKIKNLITRDMASTLNLSVGFNSLDGD